MIGIGPCSHQWVLDTDAMKDYTPMTYRCLSCGARSELSQIPREGFCRDCADKGPICPKDGLPCSIQRWLPKYN